MAVVDLVMAGLSGTVGLLGLASRAMRGATVEGDAYRIGGRTLTPIVRAWRAAPRNGTWEIGWLRPVAIVEQEGATSRRLSVPTGGLPVWVIALALTAPVAVYGVARLIAGCPLAARGTNAVPRPGR